MIFDIDPAGAVPEPGEDGRLVLDQTKGDLILAACLTFLALAAVLVSALYWADYFARRQFPPLYDAELALAARLGILLLPALPVLLAGLLHPPRLSVTEAGITLRHRGGEKTMHWGEITSLSLRTRVTRLGHAGGFSRTQCHVIGHGGKLVLAPVFGVSPAALAACLQARCRRETGTSPAITSVPDKGLTLLGLAQFSGFVLAVILAAAIMDLTGSALQGDQSAASLLSHLP